jgi:hypothetical protein
MVVVVREHTAFILQRFLRDYFLSKKRTAFIWPNVYPFLGEIVINNMCLVSNFYDIQVLIPLINYEKIEKDYNNKTKIHVKIN